VNFILDTKLLVLLTVGLTSRLYIERHKRLRPYTLRDFIILSEVIAHADGLLVTPNTVTEASNFLGYIGDPARSRIYQRFSSLIDAVTEQYVPSSVAVGDVQFTRIGITDAAILKLVDSPMLITDDLVLYLEATRRGYSVINFTHYREAHGEFEA
jgi:hypothetical protein